MLIFSIVLLKYPEQLFSYNRARAKAQRIQGFVDRVKAETGGKPLDAVMDLVGGDMTDYFIDAMIFDMNVDLNV